VKYTGTDTPRHRADRPSQTSNVRRARAAI
jgi:hypothetical protein